MPDDNSVQIANHQENSHGLHWTLHAITAPLLLLYFAPVLMWKTPATGRADT